jgi:CRISPR-associated protein Csd1
MALEPERKDRSYQWGRMLAVMEKIELDTYDSSEARETNAIRMQSIFVQRPGYAARVIMDQLKSAYYPRLPKGARIYYDRMIGEIMEQLSSYPPEIYNKPLTEMYLPGYYLQKNAFYTKKSTMEMEEEKDEI